jgi:hypothetical protein
VVDLKGWWRTVGRGGRWTSWPRGAPRAAGKMWGKKPEMMGLIDIYGDLWWFMT